MKLVILSIAFYFPLLAGTYSCPTYVKTNEQAQALHRWLSLFEDQTSLHGCELEIQVCDLEGEARDDAPMGELFVKTLDGREAYISFDIPAEPDWRYSAEVKSYTRSMYYQKRDRYFEAVSGRTEVWQLEFRTLWDDSSVLDHLELGIYSTNSQLNQINGNDSHWYNCTSEP